MDDLRTVIVRIGRSRIPESRRGGVVMAEDFFKYEVVVTLASRKIVRQFWSLKPFGSFSVGDIVKITQAWRIEEDADRAGLKTGDELRIVRIEHEIVPGGQEASNAGGHVTFIFVEPPARFPGVFERFRDVFRAPFTRGG
jgi:hypothetical protein